VYQRFHLGSLITRSFVEALGEKSRHMGQSESPNRAFQKVPRDNDHVLEEHVLWLWSRIPDTTPPLILICPRPMNVIKCKHSCEK
jgi:hypothetical protein